MDKGGSKFVVLGEASESDDEPTEPSAFRRGLVSQCVKPVIAGEASESDQDSDDYYNITTEAFVAKTKGRKAKPKTSALKYNSLLHKKLRENNLLMRKDLEDFIHGKLDFALSELHTVNSRLLTSQVHLQEAATSLRKSSACTSKLHHLLHSLDHTQFLSNINPDAFTY